MGGDPLAMDKKEWQKQHDKVVKLGGLHVIGIERHESRRIDNQLRGRAGRQGDPGSSRFYVSLEDDIMRIFGGEQISKLMTTLKMPEDVPLEHAMVSKAIEQAQVKVESFHFDSRKHLVEYDDVMNKQREVIYKRRKQVLEAEGAKLDQLKEKMQGILKMEVDRLVNKNINPMTKMPDHETVMADFLMIVPFDPGSQKRILKQLEPIQETDKMQGALMEIVNKTYEQREKQVGKDLIRQIEKLVMLNTIDKLWIDHLDAIDDLREGIGLRGYGQRDPLVEYKAEAFNMFERLIQTIDFEVARRIFRVQVMEPPRPQPEAPAPAGDFAKAFASAGSHTSEAPAGSEPAGTKRQKIGRNDPCWCGSGKKWKKCHYPQQQ